MIDHYLLFIRLLMISLELFEEYSMYNCLFLLD